VSDLAFLSPDRATEEGTARSPLERALAHSPEEIEDISLSMGVLEVRGDVGELDAGLLIRLTPTRALVICGSEQTAQIRQTLRKRFLTIDMTAGWAGIRVRGEAVLRRVTDIDLDDLPAVGALAHVQALVLRDDEETFRVLIPQEYGHHVAEVLIDALEGLGAA
jgi:sarcosine oxidase gamma subunit